MRTTTQKGRASVVETAPIARSPIAPVPPITIERGWEVSTRRSAAELKITDCTPLAKILVLASPEGELARALGVPFGRAARDPHGRALLRISGARAPDVLAKICAIDFSEVATPDGAAFSSFVAKLVTDVVRDDRGEEISYLLHCERSSGQYLFDALIDAGDEFGIEVDGFVDHGN